jgi:hypothetical protein
MKYKSVSKEEFGTFVARYPRWLVRNDFSLGDWPKSVVARHTVDPEAGWSVSATTP